MEDVQIVVRGTSRQFHPAERATVHAVVRLEGPDAHGVYQSVVQAAQQVSESVHALHRPDHGPVTWWSAQDVRTWSHRPWHQDGVQLPLVHTAGAGLQVKFSDFGRLSTWLGEMSTVRGFRVDRVEWALTAARRREAVHATRTRAVQDARSRAQEYADALGLGPVRVRAIADAGMLGDGLVPLEIGGAAYVRAAAADAAGGGELPLVPEDIEVSAEVDARFVVAHP